MLTIIYKAMCVHYILHVHVALINCTPVCITHNSVFSVEFLEQSFVKTTLSEVECNADTTLSNTGRVHVIVYPSYYFRFSDVGTEHALSHDVHQHLHWLLYGIPGE